MKDSVALRVIVKMLARLLLEQKATRKEVAQLKSLLKKTGTG